MGTETRLQKIPPVVPTDTASRWAVVSAACVYVQYVFFFFLIQAGAAASTSAGQVPPQNESDDEEIETALSKELDSLKAERNKLPSMRRFQAVDSGANNCIFIQTTVSILSDFVIYSQSIFNVLLIR